MNMGKIIDDRYRIVGELGKGSIATVYKAIDVKNNQPVALKLLQKQRRDAESILRLKREVEIMSKLDHPHVVKFLDCGEYKGASYLVTELIEGASLHVLLSSGKISTEKSFDIIYQTTQALAYVHEHGIIHRDLKPKNLLLKNNDTKVIDFCLARVINLVEIVDREAIVGTFSYMSPEQAGMLLLPADERSDLYSLGIIFYQTLTGELPFKGEDVGEILHQHIAKTPSPHSA
jgi:serine/threonine protein kinase